MFKKNKKSILIFIVMVTIFFSLSHLAVSAISSQEIINNMQKVYQKQMEGINDYTIVEKPTGGIGAFAGETKTFYKKAVINGEEVFKSRTETEVMGMKYISIYDGIYDWTTDPMTGKVEKEPAMINPSQPWKNIDSSETRFLGEEIIDGQTVYLFEMENFKKVMESMGLPSTTIPEDEFGIGTGRLWISSSNWMPIRMEISIKTGSEEGELAMNIITKIDFKDYRQVETMLHPFQLAIATSTEIDTTGLNDEEREEQEAMMNMMKSLMSGMGSFSIETLELKINTGLPDDLFDGTKLE